MKKIMSLVVLAFVWSVSVVHASNAELRAYQGPNGERVYLSPALELGEKVFHVRLTKTPLLWNDKVIKVQQSVHPRGLKYEFKYVGRDDKKENYVLLVELNASNPKDKNRLELYYPGHPKAVRLRLLKIPFTTIQQINLSADYAKEPYQPEIDFP